MRPEIGLALNKSHLNKEYIVYHNSLSTELPALMQMKKRTRRRVLVDLLMHISVNRCDQLERGRCYQCIGAVIEERCPAQALTVKLKLKSC